MPTRPTSGGPLGAHAAPLRPALPGLPARSRREPAVFYEALATDSADQLEGYLDLDGVAMLDVGGGPGYFRQRLRGPRHAPTSPSTPTSASSPASVTSRPGPSSAAGWSCRSPTRPFDLCYSSNVLEHVPRAVADGRRDGAGDEARWHRPSSRTRSGTARGAGTRPRRGTSSVARGRASATGGGTARSPRTSTASRCSP